MSVRRAIGVSGAAVVIALGLASCAGDPVPVQTELPPAPTTAASAEPTTSPDATAETPVAQEPVTCESLIGSSLIESYTEIGWTVREDAFYIGSDVPMPDGISCMWGDFSGPPSDNVAIFAYAPLDDRAANAARDQLAELGWIVEPADEGTYVTAKEEFVTVPDENGYGATYLFGDGWVIFADTKQSLLLIERPGS